MPVVAHDAAMESPTSPAMIATARRVGSVRPAATTAYIASHHISVSGTIITSVTIFCVMLIVSKSTKSIWSWSLVRTPKISFHTWSALVICGRPFVSPTIVCRLRFIRSSSRR